MEKIVFTNVEPGLNPDSKELANVIINRLGLMPRKKGSTDKMYRVLLTLYEKAKEAAQKKNPALAVMSVEEMALFAGISRQTMYEYLGRWLELNFIVKANYITSEGKKSIGYRLNGNTLESAFEKVQLKIRNNLEITQKLIRELQKVVKNEKIRQAHQQKTLDSEY